MCGAMAAAFVSCGKEVEISDSSGESVTPTQKATYMVAEKIANFTPPKEGEQIVTLKVKGYDGEIKIKLFPEYAEKGVENFVSLAGDGYYDGVIFHRIIKDFMIQGGDPEGTGRGGESKWGGSFDGGTNPNIIHAAGAVAYANSGSTATDGSQFYIVTGDKYSDESLTQLESQYGIKFSDNARQIYKEQGGAPWLDGGYTLFGQVFEGLDIVFDLQNVEVDANSAKPLTDVVIESAKVEEYGGEELRWYLSDYGEAATDGPDAG